MAVHLVQRQPLQTVLRKTCSNENIICVELVDPTELYLRSEDFLIAVLPWDYCPEHSRVCHFAVCRRQPPNVFPPLTTSPFRDSQAGIIIFLDR